jgi:hypothetical protein
MALIDQIININITNETVTAVGNNFGTIMILGDSVPDLNPNVKEYTSLTAVVADFATNTPEYLKASKIFAQVIKTPKILIGQKQDTDADYVSAYNRICSERNDFYALIVCTVNDADIEAISTSVQAQKKIMGISSSSAGILTNANDNIFELLKNTNTYRTFGMFSASPIASNYPEAALLGKMIPSTPGSSTWCYQNLVGVTATSNLTDTERANIQVNNGNYYTSFGGRDVTIDGRMFNGEFIDIIVGLDWLEYYIQANLASLLVTISNRFDKIPYTADGLTLVKNNINASLEQAVTNGIIDQDFEITMPDILTIPAIDKADRIVRGIEFTATKTGAIHKFVINGIATV